MHFVVIVFASFHYSLLVENDNLLEVKLMGNSIQIHSKLI